jgi:hypothetical protein
MTVRAAAPQAIQTAVYRGTGTMAGNGTSTFVDSIHDATAGDVGNARTSHGGSSGSGTPNPAGLGVSTKGNFTGFSGLTHVDQRLAGSGKYTNTQFSLEPPDQGLCVGNGFVLESVNTAFIVYDTHGNPLSAVTPFNQFFGVQPEVIRTTTPPTIGDFVSDPRCNFDVATQRWFMTMLQVDPPGFCQFPPPLPAVVPCPGSRAHTFISVSQTANPTGAWNLFSVDATDDGLHGTPNNSNSIVVCPCYGDQPLLGVNADGVFISTNEYGAPTLANTDPRNPEIGGQVYAISKRALEHAAGGSTLRVVHINAGAMAMPAGDCCAPFDSIQPATTSTGTGQPHGVEYFLSSFTNNPAVSHAINVWAMTGTNTLGHDHPDVDLQRTKVGSEAYAYDKPFGLPGLGSMVMDQKEGPRPLGALLISLGAPGPLPQVTGNDVRMNQVVYADGKLWAGLNTAVRSGEEGTARVAVAYFVVEPSIGDGELGADMFHQGYVSVAGNSTAFPSVAVNQQGNGAIAFSVIGPRYFPSAAYVRINSEGQLSGKVVIAGAGTAPDDGFTGYSAETGGAPVGRWGDYSAAVAAPDGSIWMASEYIPNAPRTLLANWGSFVYHVPAAGRGEGGGHGGGGGNN